MNVEMADANCDKCGKSYKFPVGNAPAKCPHCGR